MRWLRLWWWMSGLAAAIAILAVLTLAMPVPTWKTGRTDTPPLPLVAGEQRIDAGDRMWIDTDAACGAGPRVDPDDCFAVALLFRARGEAIAGVSTVFGNAPIAVTDRTARELIGELSGTAAAPPVFRGAAAPGGEPSMANRARDELRQALAEGPLAIVALGPLTNVAAALEDRPDLQANVKALVAVMGHEPDHVFHPTEGAPGAMLFGHGPIFRDFNFAQDDDAARRIVAMGLPLVLIPYDASRDIMLGDADLRALRAGGGASRWIAERARGWLDYWRRDIGQAGFYPFDLAAAAYVLRGEAFSCAPVTARIVRRRPPWSWLLARHELVVEASASAASTPPALYCPHTAADLKAALVAELGGR